MVVFGQFGCGGVFLILGFRILGLAGLADLEEASWFFSGVGNGGGFLVFFGRVGNGGGYLVFRGIRIMNTCAIGLLVVSDGSVRSDFW